MSYGSITDIDQGSLPYLVGRRSGASWRGAGAYGVATPALMTESAIVAKQLAVARFDNIDSLAEVTISDRMAHPPKGNAGAHYRVAYWLAIAAQLAGGRGVAWRELYDGAKASFAAGNLAMGGVQTSDKRGQILEAGKQLAFKHGIGESATALAQLGDTVRRKRGGSALIWIGGGVVVAGLLTALFLRR